MRPSLVVFIILAAALLASAQERSFDAEVGGSVKTGWGWAKELHEVRGRPGEAILVADATVLKDEVQALGALRGAGVPALEVLATGTLHGEPAALVSGALAAIWEDDDARFDRLHRRISREDLRKIQAASGVARIERVLVHPDGHVIVGDARPLDARGSNEPELRKRLHKLHLDAGTADGLREYDAAGPAVLPKAPGATPGIVGALANPTNKHLGSIAIGQAPLAGDAYQRGSSGGPKDIAIHLLPAIEVAPGVKTQPLGYEDDSLEIDADGAGNAWKGDPSGQPETSLQYPDGTSLDPTKTPYVVLPDGFATRHPGLQLGDIVAVFYGGKVAFAIYGDNGPGAQIGEASIATAKKLTINPDPVNGGMDKGVSFIVFPGSGTGNPLSNVEINRRGMRLLRAAGGKP